MYILKYPLRIAACQKKKQTSPDYSFHADPHGQSVVADRFLDRIRIIPSEE